MFKLKLITSILLFVTILTLTNCKKKVKGCMDSTALNYNADATEDDGSCTYDNAPKTIGQSYGGGTVFHIDNTGMHGLIAAPNDISTKRTWNNSGLVGTGAVAIAIGTGQGNTTTIVTKLGAGTYAAAACNDLELGGFSDWFLPSRDEILLMYQRMHVMGQGNFSASLYWTASEVNANDAICLDFSSGTAITTVKTSTLLVRPVRAF